MSPRPTPRKGELRSVAPPPPPSDEGTLNVALYPYVPSPQAFVAAVEHAWQRLDTGVALNFCDYDPYRGPPPPTLDVFAYDCIFADDLVVHGHLDLIAAAEIDDLGDIMAFAVDAVLMEHGYAGIPYLGCTNVLYYRASDPEVGQVSSLEQLLETFGVATFPDPQPLPGRGLLIDMGGATTDACIYAAIWRQTYGLWPSSFSTQLPPQLDQLVMGGMNCLAAAAGRAQALYDDTCGYDRTTWFAKGRGRGLVGYTETMSSWTPTELAELRFVPLPTAVSPTCEPVSMSCFTDAVGIRPGLDAIKRDVAVTLCNVIASTNVMLAALHPAPSAQYLTPARKGVLEALAAASPPYAAIATMFDEHTQTPLRLGTGVREWAPWAGADIIGWLFPGTAAQPAAARRHAQWHTTPAGIWRRERRR